MEGVQRRSAELLPAATVTGIAAIEIHNTFGIYCHVLMVCLCSVYSSVSVSVYT